MGYNSQENFEELRSVFDGKESFMTTGHQIHKTREFVREVPEWMLNSQAIDEFLKKRFPFAFWNCQYECPDEYRYVCGCKTCTDTCNRELWLLTIRVCFRMGKTAAQAAVEWNGDHIIEWCEEDGTWAKRSLSTVKPARIRRIIQMIRLAEAGRRLDCRPRSFGRAGRPRKSACTLQTTYERAISPDANPTITI